ncbi:MAG: glutamate racemase [Firmicutes bacterium]|nr:glutamate racemase [Bacillota bacterium]MCL5065431.1 glutamate racemase [Bacillota bacterium]
MGKRPIAVFDSGEGGLTVLKQARELYSGEDYLYVCDSAHFPYGPRSLDEVKGFFLAILDFILTRAPKAVIIACNTATAAALEPARKASPVPVVGVIEAGVEAALKVTETHRIGVLATEATSRSGIYRRTFQERDANTVVVERPCPRLVVLAENGWTDGPQCRRTVHQCLAGVLAEQVDTVVLGCTHFPHMQSVFQQAVYGRAKLIDPGLETARQLPRYLDDLSHAGGGSLEFYTTGHPGEVTRVARQLWPNQILQALPLVWQGSAVRDPRRLPG